MESGGSRRRGAVGKSVKGFTGDKNRARIIEIRARGVTERKKKR